MASLQVPMSIWINLGLLVAAAAYVRYRLTATGETKKPEPSAKPVHQGLKTALK